MKGSKSEITLDGNLMFRKKAENQGELYPETRAVVHSCCMSAREFRLPAGWSRERSLHRSTKFLALSHLRDLRGSEQVAAVCYRVRRSAIEFLLVRTRRGRWIFPKGSAETGLTHAQAAALEAFEEAGVHGRIEEAPFTRYVRRKHTGSARSTAVEFTVHAHLCEVLWLDQPQEMDRDPAWLNVERAKRHLRDGRDNSYGAELARVVERAVMRIRHLHVGTSTFLDSTQRVRFIDDYKRTSRRSQL